MKYFIATLSNSSLPLLHNGKTHNLILMQTRKQSKYRSTWIKRRIFYSPLTFKRFHSFFFYILLWVHVSLFRVLFQTLVRGKHKSVFLATENKFRLLLWRQVDRISRPDFFWIVKEINAAFLAGTVFFSGAGFLGWEKEEKRGLKWSWNKCVECSVLIRIKAEKKKNGSLIGLKIKLERRNGLLSGLKENKQTS